MASRIPPAANRARALELSLSGCNVATIASELGCSDRTVKRYLAAAHARLEEETIQSAALRRARMTAQLDEIRVSQWDQRDDPQHANVLVRLAEREAKLWGLDAPSQVEHLLEPERAQKVLGFALGGAMRLFVQLREAILAGVERDQLVVLLDEGRALYVAEFRAQAAAELEPGSAAA